MISCIADYMYKVIWECIGSEDELPYLTAVNA